MEKEENQNTTAKSNQEPEKETAKPEENLDIENKEEAAQEAKEEIKEPTPEEKIAELEDKVARTFAEMENQRRRFEKEKEEAFEYGGYNFAKEALNLIDNLERSKQILETDEKLKDTEALKKSLEHLDIIKKDTISIFEKNNIPCSLVGNIGKSGSSTTYNTSSDYRLKENDVAISDGITRLKQFRPIRFNWKEFPEKGKEDGFFAHEVSSIVPEAVSGDKDGIITQEYIDEGKELQVHLGNPIIQSLDHSKLVPLLTAALQEAITKIETLETKVAALEG